MPRFLAICADPKDGPDYKISVEAPDRSAALNKLRTRHTVTRLLDDSAETPAPGEQPMEEVPFSDRALERIAAAGVKRISTGGAMERTRSTPSCAPPAR